MRWARSFCASSSSVLIQPRSSSKRRKDEVREGAADHAWNGGYGFENDGAVAVAAPKERVGQEPKERHAPKGKPVGKI
jgi:hypothetical protein